MCVLTLFFKTATLGCGLAIFSICLFSVNTFSSEITTFPDGYIEKCNKSAYLAVNSLKCTICDTVKHLIPSPSNKMHCVCNNVSRQVKWNKAEHPVCSLCKTDEIATRDGKFCIKCPNISKDASTNKNPKTRKCTSCSVNEISIERSINGSLLPFLQCIPCAPGTQPSPDGTICVPCLINYNGSCSCPSSSHEIVAPDVCASHHELASWPDEPATYTIEYPQSNKMVQSKLLQNNLRRDIYLCKQKNPACQSVANLCTLTHFRDGPTCSMFRDHKHIPNAGSKYPWLYYGDGDAPTVLNRRKIPTRFSLDPHSQMKWINLTAGRWSLNGTWIGLSPTPAALLHLCPGDWVSQNAALRYATRYRQQCILRPSQLLASPSNNQFISLYLQFQNTLYAVPVLDTNYQHANRFPNKVISPTISQAITSMSAASLRGEIPAKYHPLPLAVIKSFSYFEGSGTLNIANGKNYDSFKESDYGQWQLARRFFLVDTTSGIPFNGSKPEVVQYLKSATIRIRCQKGEEQGKIYPPVLIVQYGEIGTHDMEIDKPFSVSFSVDFYMDSHVTYTIDIWLGVLCGLAVVWSTLQTWSLCKRSAHLVIDLVTLFHLCIITCGNLSNVFFSVVALAAVHSFVYYKGQSVAQVLLPSATLDGYVHTYVIVAFSLKLIEVINMIWRQMTVDIFLIDWERPRATKDNPQPVSIWRTYFVANEWNEIQSHRKTSLTVQLISTVLLVKIFGLENWAVSDPDLNNVINQEMVYRPANFTLQFALAFLVYVFVYTVQWLLLRAFYERFIKNGIQEFVDVCSLANISVFILTLENFGYYIHGRSAHGFADTDMQTIMNQLKREEEDLVGHRGLLPASDHQTFQMYIPSQLRSYYRRVMPTNLMAKQLPSAVTTALRLKLSGVSSADFDRSVLAYNNMNKFLAAFLEHALRDLDFEVRDKLFAEALLDVEFSDVPGKAVFYIDNGHSFDNVLFYGNELTLFSMDLMVFCFFQVATGDFLLAAIITAFIAKVLLVIRHVGGRKNLAKKTLIDERFLI